MLKVLILTNNQDCHAKVIAEGLTKKGALAIQWFPEEYLLNQKSHQSITSKGEHFITIQSNKTINLCDIDVVWDRRSRFPIVPQTIDPLDQKFIETENRLHMKSLWLTLGETAKWINPLHSVDKSNSKIFQLREAARIGLIIPKTIITNDKEAIIEFIELNLPHGPLYKTFSPAHWKVNDVVYGCYSTAITPHMLSSEVCMALTPGIYQKIVKKRFEVRITFFKNEYIAVKIHNSEELDWRILNNSPKFKLSPIKIPLDIENKCISLMQSLGIVFGCFDFIVTPSDEYVFLEVNPMGQFLWIEEILPALKLADKFCEFLLTSESKRQVEMSNSNTVSLKEIVESTP